MSYISRFCQLIDLVKIHICSKGFISIVYVVVKFKIFKGWHDEVTHFWGFWVLLPQILIDLAGILIRGSL